MKPANQLIDHAITATPRSLWWVLSALCASVILYVGSRPGSSIPDLSVLPTGADKVLHFCAYSGFAACLFRACVPLRASEPLRGLMPWLPVVVLPLLVGALDEYNQGFAKGRGQDPLDLLADTLGGIWVCAVGLYWRARVRAADQELRRKARRD